MAWSRRYALAIVDTSRARPAPTIAKAYRLLHAICATALEDGLITRNPCVIKGASAERPAERPVATIEQVYAIADAIEPRYRATVLLATFCAIRVGELRALRQVNLDVLHRSVLVVEQYQQLGDGTLVLGPPKTDAGVRRVAIPAVLVPDLEAHLATWVSPGRSISSFPASPAAPSEQRRCTLHGIVPSALWGSRACASTISATLETRSLRRPVRARRSSCRGWAMLRRERR